MKNLIFTLLFSFASSFIFAGSPPGNPPAGELLITGVFDTQPSGAGVKGIELKATTAIADLSKYGVGSANNGGGSVGSEVTLPAMSVAAGECIYVVTNSQQFIDFFGVTPNVLVVSSAANINGDDAIELFEDGVVVDVFGDISYAPGTMLAWNYLDGWAYRVSGTGPDGSTFNINNWTFSGIDVFDNVPNNASATTPFPTCTYTTVAPTTAVANDDNASTGINSAVNINVLVNDVLPNPLISMTIFTQATNGTAVANGLTDITYTPNAGFCGTDNFTYRICDAVGCDNATVTVTVNCPVSYPPRNISVMTTVNASGIPDSLGKSCELKGIVHGVDLNGGNAIQFVIIDATGGIATFSNNNYGYTVTEGDEVIIRGAISQFNCLTQITPDTLWKTTAGNPLVTPAVTTGLNESFESELLRINNLTLVTPAEWTGAGTGFTVKVTDGVNTYDLRIDNDVDLYSMPAPTGTFHAIGIGGQFDNDGTCDGGYQFLPRYSQDIIPVTSTDEKLLGQQIQLYPNPVLDRLFIKTEVKIDALSIANMLGQRLMVSNNPGNFVDVSELEAGIYLITFQAGEVGWTAKFVKN